MSAKASFRGHPIVWENEQWVYEDTRKPLPATGGETRPCAKCGSDFTLGHGEVDTCLGVLPGVDNACCGHGDPKESYIRFTNGVVVRGFTSVEYTEKHEKFVSDEKYPPPPLPLPPLPPTSRVIVTSAGKTSLAALAQYEKDCQYVKDENKRRGY